MKKVVEIEDENKNKFDNAAIMKAKAETDFMVGNYKEALKTICPIAKTNSLWINTAKVLRYTLLVNCVFYICRCINPIILSLNMVKSQIAYGVSSSGAGWQRFL